MSSLSAAGVRRFWPSALVTLVLFAAYSPYLVYDFGFHNDFEIWAYNNKVCCSGFPETAYLIQIGRFLQAYLQNIYLSFFTDLDSLVYGRAFGVALAAASALLLAAAVRRAGMDRFTAIAFGLCAFLLPPAQVNLGWVTNLVPGLLNSVLVLLAALLFPRWEAVAQRAPSALIRLAGTYVLLLATLFIYPPTIGLFLLPTLAFLLWRDGSSRVPETLYAVIVVGVACVSYFAIHRAYMAVADVGYAGSLYQFRLTTAIGMNLQRFGGEILPAMLNLWNPSPLIAVTLAVTLIIVIGCVIGLGRASTRDGNQSWVTGRAASAVLIVGLFLAINAPGLAGAGKPPLFYRPWHPGGAAVLLLTFYAAAVLVPTRLAPSVFVALTAMGGLFAYDSSRHVATTLANQFQFAVEQIHAQFSPDREHYVLIEQRPRSLRFGRERWGELGFVHILSRGHAIYVLQRDFNHPIHPLLEQIVVTRADAEVLLEPELLEKSRWVFRRAALSEVNARSDAAFDFRENTAYTGALPGSFDVIGSARVTCYTLRAGPAPSPARMPRAWRLLGTNDGGATWTTLSTVSGETGWHEGEARVYNVAQPAHYQQHRLDVDAGNDPKEFELPELQLMIADSPCRDVATEYVREPEASLTRSFATMSNGLPVSFIGTATESGISDPPFRLLRALDNIYYTFWETFARLPIEVQFTFVAPKTIRCYAISAGDDDTNSRMPKAWTLSGSDDRRSWTDIDRRTSEEGWTDNSRRTYSVASPGAYPFYRLSFTEVNGDRFFRIYELELSEDAGCERGIP